VSVRGLPSGFVGEVEEGVGGMDQSKDEKQYILISKRPRGPSGLAWNVLMHHLEAWIEEMAEHTSSRKEFRRVQMCTRNGLPARCQLRALPRDALCCALKGWKGSGNRTKI
jgi:hypothetical protein